MFEFYGIVAVPNTDEKEIKQFQYAETPENLTLKERLETELSAYERVVVTIIDRYYHADEYEETHPLSLAESVFEGETFVGYMVDGLFYTTPENKVLVYENVRGATSVRVAEEIRRRDR